MIVGGEGETHPNRVRIFKNRPHMTFDDIACAADQEIELAHGAPAEYSTKVVTFSSVYHLSLHFPGNRGGPVTRIHYVGLRGEFAPSHRHGVTICTYEARPNMGDHKNPLEEHLTHHIQ